MGEEELRKEVLGLLSGERGKLSETKKVIFDRQTEQFSIKIPKKLVEASQTNPETEFRMVVNPNRKDVEEILGSHFIIYAKEKTITKSN
jgi:hypothetical protein